ncbi:MAG: hypothetical protein COT74_04895 [Bdellovibrionales bacterium CG10_big_fil_rev_8_21_14_0_10_45_34]|nr:MAG: hypothetical protein COT74_04895 [Bdellovibrionales bacterium CG10_big_fil_rev_8_21_14_0_10_45_34]
MSTNMDLIEFEESSAEEPDSEGTWAISYGDMITLLLGFFVLFFSFDPSQTKQAGVTQAIIQAISTNVEKNSSERSPAALSKFSSSREGIDEVTIEKLGAKAYQVGAKVLVEFPGVSFFDSGETSLTLQGRAALEKFVVKYLPYAGGHNLSIMAYTDPKPVIASAKRKFQDNLELSALRSVSAMRRLQHSGLPLDTMRISGYGVSEFNESEKGQLPEHLKKSDLHALHRKVLLVISPRGTI